MDTTELGQAERIRQHRTAEAVLRLKDANGRPMANTTVTVRQTRHQFLFGCNIFMLTPQVLSETQQAYKKRFAALSGIWHTEPGSWEQQAYQKRFAALFNFATLPFFWETYEMEPGRPDEERLQTMARWCREHDIVTKGHPLCWHLLPPPWHADTPLEEMRQQQMYRIQREVETFRGLVDMWDVVNEAVFTPHFTRDPNHMTPIVQSLGVVPIVKEAFARARQANPKAVLLLNDFDRTPAYEELIEQCLDAGVEIDAIGMQSHMHQGYFGNEAVWSLCERLAKFHKPLHWTEVTLISGDCKPGNDFNTRQAPWPSTPEGESRQAEDIAAFYSTLYSHPAVEAITWWDFCDGCWLGAPSGLLRNDMSPKPAYERLRQLIKGEWWFGQQTLRTDPAGEASFRGALGEYELAAAGKKALFMHDKRGPYNVTLSTRPHQ